VKIRRGAARKPSGGGQKKVKGGVNRTPEMKKGRGENFAKKKRGHIKGGVLGGGGGGFVWG